MAEQHCMNEYLQKISVPYIKKKWHKLKLADNYPAVVIFDVFKGQVIPSFLKKLQEHHIHYAKVPTNCTDTCRLNPLMSV